MLSDKEYEFVLAKFKEIISVSDRLGTVQEVLDKLGIKLPAVQTEASIVADDFFSNPMGKVLIIGNFSIKPGNLSEIISDEFGINQITVNRRFDFVNGYKDIANYNFTKITKTKYAAIFIGPMPHSGAEKGEESSILLNLEKNKDGIYPPVFRMMANNKLKITGENVKETLNKLVSEEKLILS